MHLCLNEVKNCELRTKNCNALRLMMDHQTFEKQRFGGISRYFYELASRMTDIETTIPLRYSVNQYIMQRDVTRFTAPPQWLYKMFKGNFKSLNRRHTVRTMRHTDFDIFHPTYYDPYFLPHLGDRPFVLTIHDMTHERYPQYFSPSDPTPERKRLLASRAARIIAISQNTKRDIVELLGVPEEKIDVIYHGISSPLVPLIGCAALGLPDHYILYVGERRWYKNFQRTLAAFSELRRSHPDLHLVLTGRPLSRSEQRWLSEMGVSQAVHCLSDVSDYRLSQLYRHALAFVYPSCYEGFGIPILEAFAQDCPVCLSQGSCFPEVAGEAAVYFQPGETDDILRALRTLVEDATLRSHLAQLGRQRLPLFTWDRTARQTEDTYRKALNSEDETLRYENEKEYGYASIEK